MKPSIGSLIDTHCHLDMPEFDPDREEVIRRAKDAGVEAIITIGSGLQSSFKAVELSERHDLIYASIGVHPHDAKDFNDEAYEKLKELSFNKKVVAIGETGLDYHYDNSPRGIQREVMRRHIGLAVERNLPAIIHSREAQADTIGILRESGLKKGLLHCFSGSIETAEAAMSMGLYISIAGPVTFKNAVKLKDIASAIPDEYILMETDAPYLAPVPVRGKRNEPAFIAHVAEELARLRGVSPEDIARITSLNAKRLFGIGEIRLKGEIAYMIRDSLYLNITNRCTNKCSFCIRFHSDYVKGHNLRLEEEPTTEEIKGAIGEPSLYKEVVFCGYGEPFLRLDAIKDVAFWIKQKGGRVRVNTNGHGNMIHGRNILPELSGLVDELSVSLDTHDADSYERLCSPVFKNAYEGVLDFIREARKYIPDVGVTVIGMEGVDAGAARKVADALGVRLRIRKLDIVG
jgi:TatD DNase family protein